MSYTKGVGAGFTHNWTYRGHWKETKLKASKWKIRFRATKRTHAKGYGSYPKGFRVKWKINAVQYVKKVAPGKYETVMIGTKKPLAAGRNKLRKLYKHKKRR